MQDVREILYMEHRVRRRLYTFNFNISLRYSSVLNTLHCFAYLF